MSHCHVAIAQVLCAEMSCFLSLHAGNDTGFAKEQELFYSAIWAKNLWRQLYGPPHRSEEAPTWFQFANFPKPAQFKQLQQCRKPCMNKKVQILKERNGKIQMNLAGTTVVAVCHSQRKRHCFITCKSSTIDDKRGVPQVIHSHLRLPGTEPCLPLQGLVSRTCEVMSSRHVSAVSCGGVWINNELVSRGGCLPNDDTWCGKSSCRLSFMGKQKLGFQNSHFESVSHVKQWFWCSVLVSLPTRPATRQQSTLSLYTCVIIWKTKLIAFVPLTFYRIVSWLFLPAFVSVTKLHDFTR